MLNPFLLIFFNILVLFISSTLCIRLVNTLFPYKMVRYIILPGVIIHELSHAALCFVFRHKIEQISFLNTDYTSTTLGFVLHSYNPRSLYQQIGNFFISIAPIFGGYFFLFILLNNIFNLDLYHLNIDSLIAYIELTSFGELILVGYLILTISITLCPSSQDFKNSMVGGILFVIIILIGLMLIPSIEQYVNKLVNFITPILSLVCLVSLVMLFFLSLMYLFFKGLRIFR